MPPSRVGADAAGTGSYYSSLNLMKFYCGLEVRGEVIQSPNNVDNSILSILLSTNTLEGCHVCPPEQLGGTVTSFLCNK